MSFFNFTVDEGRRSDLNQEILYTLEKNRGANSSPECCDGVSNHRLDRMKTGCTVILDITGAVGYVQDLVFIDP